MFSGIFRGTLHELKVPIHKNGRNRSDQQSNRRAPPATLSNLLRTTLIIFYQSLRPSDYYFFYNPTRIECATKFPISGRKSTCDHVIANLPEKDNKCLAGGIIRFSVIEAFELEMPDTPYFVDDGNQ